MHSPTLLLLVIVVVVTQVDVAACKKVLDEPICTSRYNFESSLLRDMLKMELDMSVLTKSYNDDIAKLQAEVKLTSEKLETAARQLEESQAQAVRELTALGGAQQKASDDKIQALEATKTLLQDNINTRFSSSELQLETKLNEIRAAAVKRPVAFLVKTLPDATAGNNKILKFTESIWNTDDVYDSNSGYFTAPLNGTYMFNLQLCYYNAKYIHAQMVADGVVITNAMLYDADGGLPCSTLSGVAVLAKSGRVCARFGTSSSSGNVLYQQEGYRFASFMGALVN